MHMKSSMKLEESKLGKLTKGGNMM